MHYTFYYFVIFFVAFVLFNVAYLFKLTKQILGTRKSCFIFLNLPSNQILKLKPTTLYMFLSPTTDINNKKKMSACPKAVPCHLMVEKQKVNM